MREVGKDNCYFLCVLYISRSNRSINIPMYHFFIYELLLWTISGFFRVAFLFLSPFAIKLFTVQCVIIYFLYPLNPRHILPLSCYLTFYFWFLSRYRQKYLSLFKLFLHNVMLSCWVLVTFFNKCTEYLFSFAEGVLRWLNTQHSSRCLVISRIHKDRPGFTLPCLYSDLSYLS